MFRIKICGVRRRRDVEATAQAGADAIGLNFVRQSVRFIDVETASELAEDAADFGLARVGVFVDEPVSQILDYSQQVGLDYVQLHGYEPPDHALRLMDAGEQVIRAIRLPVGRLTPDEIEERVAPWRELGCGLLLDADAGAQAGGAGLRLDWGAIGDWQARFGSSDSWALAGGLTPQTVAKAIAQANAPGVDVASGVEQPRGQKSGELIEGFVRNCGSLMRRRNRG